MSHHGKGPFDGYDAETAEMMRNAARDAFQNFGATGKFPKGKIAKHDEGEIQFGVSHNGGKVILNFGTPIAWVGFDPHQAMQLSNLLAKHARDARRGR